MAIHFNSSLNNWARKDKSLLFTPKDVDVPLPLWLSSRSEGKVITDGAQQFTATNSQYFIGPANNALTGNVDMTICGWVYMDTLGTTKGIAGKWDFTNAQRVWWISINTSNQVQFSATPDGVTTTSIAGTSVTLATGVWNFFRVWHDSANDQIGIQVNNGTKHTTAFASGLFNVSEPLLLGAQNSPSPINFHNGRIDSIGAYNRLLSDAEATDLFNGGSGRTYSSLSGALKTNLHEWFDMDESSGSVVGAHAGITLTASASRPTITTGIAQGQANDNDVVRSWVDITSNAHQFNQTTVSTKPLHKNAIINGSPAVRFDGVDDQMTGGASTLSISNNVSALTLVQVGGWTSFKAGSDSFSAGMTTGSGGTRAALAGGADSSGSGSRKLIARGLDTDAASTISTGVVYPTGPEILIGVIDYVNKRGRLLRNGTEILAYTAFPNMNGTGTSSATNSTVFSLGALNGTLHCPMDLMDFLVYTGIPSDAALLQIARYYGPKIGVAIA